MNSPLVSVVIPAFNAQHFIGSAVDSILAQTMNDFELILINDGSTDGTLIQMQQRAALDKRIRIISRENMGLIYSLNEGIDMARGDWVARMDADDLSNPRRLAVQLAWLKARRADVGGAWIRTFGHTIPQTRRFHSDDCTARFQLLFNSCFAHPSVLARRKILIANQYSKAALHAEDYELWCRLAAAGYQLTNTPEVLLRYRLHSSQVTQLRHHEQTLARQSIAERYRAQCFSEVPQVIHHMIMLRDVLLSREQIASVAAWFAEEIHRASYPVEVLAENAFIFLARHAEAGVGSMLGHANACGVSTFKRAVLLTLSALGATQKSFLFKLLYAAR